MRVMTWNLWWQFGPWESRQSTIASTLADQQPDIVCLQEVWSTEDGVDQARHLAEPAGLHVARTTERFHKGVSFGNAILSRWPILETESRPLPPTGRTGAHRFVLYALIDADGGPIPVFCTHLSYRFDESALRDQQVRLILDFIAAKRGNPEVDHPPILAGDLNAVPTSDEIRLLTGERPPPIPGLVMTDAWPQRGEGPGHTWSHTNSNVTDPSWPERRIDYVLVGWPRPKPLGNIIGCHLAGTDAAEGVHPSDHYAVVADLAERQGTLDHRPSS